MNGKEIIPLVSNTMLTRIFKNPENIPIVEYFIADFRITFRKIKGNIKLYPPDEEFELTFKPIDFTLTLEELTINFTFIHLYSEKQIEEASAYGGYIFGRQADKEDFEERDLEKMLQIQFRTFRCHEDERICHFYLFREQNHPEIILTDLFEFDTLDLSLASELYQTNKENNLTRWCIVFGSNNIDKIKAAINNDLLPGNLKKQLLDFIIHYSNDKETREEYKKELTLEKENL